MSSSPSSSTTTASSFHGFMSPELYTAVSDITGGTVGGIGIVISGHPFDTLKVRLQTQDPLHPRYSGLVDCVRQTLSQEGMGGFYKGVASPLYGQMLFNAVQFLAYGKAKEIAQQLLPASPEERRKEGEGGLSIPQCFVAGALTGSVVAFIESPIDLMKTQLQTQVFKPKPLFTTFFGTVRHIAGTYGVRGVYQGLGPTIIRNIPAVSLYFGVYEWGRRALAAPGESVDNLPSYKLLGAGAMGGFAYWALVYPVDVIKSAIQSQSPNPAERQYTGVLDAARKMYASGGVKRFFVGLSPCLLRAAPANGVCFMLYQKTVEIMDKHKHTFIAAQGK